MYVDLILNLALLIAISVVSGFIRQRWDRYSNSGAAVQGLLFGSAAVIGMLRPVIFAPGIIFDGRSVVVSLCALFFGPVAALVAAAAAALGRVLIGGDGTATGIYVVFSAAIVGMLAHVRRRQRPDAPSASELYLFGIVVHLAMLAMMFTMPADTRGVILEQVTVPILLTFPIATILAGRVLADQETSARFVEELQRTKEQLQRAVRAGDVGLWDWDLRTNRVYYSPEWKRQLGYEDHEISNDISEWESRLHPDERERIVRAARDHVSNSGPSLDFELRFRHKDGSYRHILSRGSKLLDETGAAVRIVATHVDITARVELQAQLLQSQKMETVGRLAGGIAHDFNNLLTVINGTADLALVALRPTDPLRADLEQIKQAGDRAASLTRQLLAFSRKQIMAPAVLNLTTLVAGMESMLIRLLGENVRLVVPPSSSLGNVRADPGQIEQVIMNLAINARDAMPDGGTLTIATADEDVPAWLDDDEALPQPGPFVVLTVSDTGTGMDETTRSRIFEPFFTTKEPGQGTGLGLATVYGIVKQSGGHIIVTSQPGAGSTFRIFLPRHTGPVTARQAPAPAAEPVAGPEHILVVEDEEALRHLATRILQSAGYTVHPVGSGDEALAVLEERSGAVNLVLTDVMLPGMGGRELSARIAAAYPDIPVLLTSGYPGDAGAHEGLDTLPGHFVAKPYTKAELTRCVRRVLDGRAS